MHEEGRMFWGFVELVAAENGTGGQGVWLFSMELFSMEHQVP